MVPILIIEPFPIFEFVFITALASTTVPKDTLADGLIYAVG